ncbi:ATP-binding protein [Streptomyces sp. NRRL S-87]|uniref:ATP-binding protein n=1 Tax=Streptomyces sp. NRRL S-87 TaxID=1463920 RepID=UPI002D219E7B|nr:ATP-binding protein [Streptomyces sp. NRRL S-87]
MHPRRHRHLDPPRRNPRPHHRPRPLPRSHGRRLTRTPEDRSHQPFHRPELIDLLANLDTPNRRGVLVLGNPGVGKTVLLQQLERELQRQGRAAFLISLRDIDLDDLSALIMNEITQVVDASEVETERTIRASGGDRLRQTTAALNQVADRLSAPVLLLDGLNESGYPQRMAAAVEELSHGLEGWRLVLTSRLDGLEYR